MICNLVLVVAGTLREFFSYIDETESKNRTVYSSGKAILDGVRYEFANSERAFRGRRNFRVVFYGTWTRYDSEFLDAIKHYEKADAIFRDLPCP